MITPAVLINAAGVTLGSCDVPGSCDVVRFGGSVFVRQQPEEFMRVGHLTLAVFRPTDVYHAERLQPVEGG